MTCPKCGKPMRSCSDGMNALWLCAICEVTKPRLLPAALKSARAAVPKSPIRKPRVGPTEHEMQVRLFEEIRKHAKRNDHLKCAFAVPNGLRCSQRTAIKAIAEGLESGVPDLLLPVASGGFYGLALELKVGRNKPSEKQQAWLGRLRGEGWRAEVVRDDWTIAWGVVCEYLGYVPS